MAEAEDRTSPAPAPAPADALAPWDGFDGFFVATHPAMVRALALALGDADLGRDAAAEGFAKALPRWDQVGRYANPAGWVYRVGLNWGRSRWRKQRREIGGLEIERAEIDAATSRAHDPDLVAALGRLSVDHRAVIVGRYYLDWSEAQLAAALDVAPGTVKSRLNRALTALAEIMETRG